MGSKFSSGEVDGFKTAQDGHMSDNCIIYAHSGYATGTDGQLSAFYVTGSSTSCGFLEVSDKKLFGDQVTIPAYSAELRVPQTLWIDSRSLIYVYSGTYSIYSIQHGRTANTYLLKDFDI